MDSLVRRQTTTTDTTSTSSSISAFLCTLIPLLLINAIYIALFLIFRKKFKRIYEPRTFLGSFPEWQRSPPTSGGMFGWIKDFYALPDEYVLMHQSLDGYLYLRFYKIIVVICAVGTIITWPILFPVNATGGGGQKEFDLLSFSNVVNANRYYAHTLIGFLFFGFVMFMIARESLYYVHLRQAYLLSPRVASRMSSRTVLFTDVPDEYLNEARLRETYPYIKHVWIATDCDELEDLIEKERDKTAMKLEGAECALSKAANAQRLKLRKKGNDLDNPLQWVDENKRPTHRLKPLIGHKVDTIDWCRDHLSTVIPEVEAMQAAHYNGKTTKISAVFIEFETVEAAESAHQRLVFKKARIMTPRAIGVTPNQIIWKGLKKSWMTRKLLYIAFSILVALLIWFWTPITVFIGVISNISYLSSISFLTWIQKIPSVILGLITGLLPSILLALIMALVPIFLRIFAKQAGAVTKGEVEIMTQGWYFWFQLIIVFLVTTLSSGAASAGKQIADDPSSAATLLAQDLPKASNFYIQYFIIFGVGTSASTLFNVAAVAIYIILGKLLDKTPRKKYNRYVNISGVGWGSNYPKYTTIAVIAIAYSMIAPLVLGFATIGLLLLYIAFRYELIYTMDTTDVNVQGACYAKALQQLTAGVYLAELCLIGLFSIKTASQKSAAGPLVLMFIFFIITILLHIAIRRVLKPFSRDHISAYNKRQNTSSHAERGLSTDNTTLNNNEQEQLVAGKGESVLATSKDEPKWKRAVYRMLRPAAIPEFAQYLAEPLPDYPADVRREAYLNPAITSPTPLLWIVHDQMGISAREKNDSGKVLGVTDTGAWWAADTGKLTTVWEGAGEKEGEMLREVPVWEERVEY